jgi:hypothetical protein
MVTFASAASQSSNLRSLACDSTVSAVASFVIVRPAPSLHECSLAGSIRSDGVRTRLMVCTNGDGAHHEGSNKRVVAKPAAA